MPGDGNGKQDNIIRFPGQAPQGVFVIRVELVLMPYPVWRRLRIAEHATFWDLHVAIQDAMGWSRRRRHLFTVDHPHSGKRLRLGIPEGETFYGRESVLPSWQIRVAELARQDLPPFLYTHHLGEEWQHEVQLEAKQAAPADGPTPACLAGEGICPVEGCGGAEVFAREYRQRRASGVASDAGGGVFRPQDVRFCDPGQVWRELFAEP
jgi:hypothetical protein